jgi:thioredoxin reductase (NADPH)
MKKKITIIGSGPAGLTAAIYAARSGLEPLIIEGKQPGGQLMGTSLVENWPGEKSIMGPELMVRMREQAVHQGAEFLSEEVVEVDLAKNPFTLTTHKQTTITSDAVIIATGATPKRLNCPGEKEYWGKGVSTCAICDAAFYKNRPVIIIGGGDTAMEEASFMARFTDRITIIHILSQLTATQAMQDRVINNPKISIIYSSSVTEIQGDGTKVTGVAFTDTVTGEKHNLATDGVFIAIGLTPNTTLFKNKLELDRFGYIRLKNHTKTSIEGIFAAGDVADFEYRQAVTSAGTGCMAALDAEKYLKKLEDSLQ